MRKNIAKNKYLNRNCISMLVIEIKIGLHHKVLDEDTGPDRDEDESTDDL